MIVDQLRTHVESVLSKRKARKNLEKRVAAFANEGGIELSVNDQQSMADLGERYVRDTVELIAACDEVAGRMGIAAVAGPILLTASRYFLNPDDYVADSKGLYGLLDDAYLACRFIARLSQVFEAERGMSLLDKTLDELSPTIGVLIGEPLSSQLDAEVETTLGQVISQVQLAQLQPLPINEAARWANVQRGRQINDEARLMAIASGGGY